MQQNETLVKKYLRKSDVYVHAEVHGASSVIVKNHTTSPVPPLTLSQAGSMTICRSAAWKDKITVEAYWVNPEQVSKSAPTGLSLPTGSFMIRGRKNFLPRAPLVMGIGLLFRLDESCRAKHAGERHVRLVGDEPAAEDKFDQVGALPSLGASSDAADRRSSSSKKKKSTGGSGQSSSSKKKKKAPQPAEASEDFDVTSNLQPARAAAAAVKLSSEDEGTDAEADAKTARIAQLASSSEGGKAAAPAAGQRKKISAAERKRMKKGSSKTADAESSEPAEKAAPAEPAAAPLAADESSSEGEEFGAKKRNKKKKSKAKSTGAAGAADSTAAPAAPAAKPLPRGKRNKVSSPSRWIAGTFVCLRRPHLCLAVCSAVC